MVVGTALLGKAALIEWVNGLCKSHYADITSIPPKAFARVLHAMHGDASCALNRIDFRDGLSRAEALANAEEALSMARRVGFTGELLPPAWIDENDFANTILLWRWIREESESHPFPPDATFDISAPVVASPQNQSAETVASVSGEGYLPEALSPPTGPVAPSRESNGAILRKKLRAATKECLDRKLALRAAMIKSCKEGDTKKLVELVEKSIRE